MRKNRFTGQWPEGSIRSKEEMLDLVTKAQNGDKIIIYLVRQSGTIEAYKLNEDSRYEVNPCLEGTEEYLGLCVGPTFDKVTIYRKGYRFFEETQDWDWRNYKVDLLMGTGGLNGDTYGTEHRYFSDFEKAKIYGEELTSDPEYMQQVKDWDEYFRKWYDIVDSYPDN